jgi:hypothetical protein
MFSSAHGAALDHLESQRVLETRCADDRRAALATIGEQLYDRLRRERRTTGAMMVSGRATTTIKSRSSKNAEPFRSTPPDVSSDLQSLNVSWW